MLKTWDIIQNSIKLYNSVEMATRWDEVRRGEFASSSHINLSNVPITQILHSNCILYITPTILINHGNAASDMMRQCCLVRWCGGGVGDVTLLCHAAPFWWRDAVVLYSAILVTERHFVTWQPIGTWQPLVTKWLLVMWHWLVVT